MQYSEIARVNMRLCGRKNVTMELKASEQFELAEVPKMCYNIADARCYFCNLYISNATRSARLY